MSVAAAGLFSLFFRCAMNNRESRVIEGAKSGVRFVLRLPNAPSRVVEAAKRVTTAVSSAVAAEREQTKAKNSRKLPRYSANRAKAILLRKHLDPIAADGLVMLSGLPGIKDSLRLPRIKDAPEAHLAAAQRVRRIAEEHEAEFITQYDYSADFLERLDKAVQDVETANKADRGSARARYSRATREMKDEIAAVRRALDALDTRIVEAYMDDPAVLKDWRWESRVPAKLGRPKKRKSARKGDHGASTNVLLWREEPERAQSASDSR